MRTSGGILVRVGDGVGVSREKECHWEFSVVALNYPGQKYLCKGILIIDINISINAN